MKQIIYKEIVEIDGINHIILSCDYSESINEAISDEVLQDNNDEIIDYITDDILSSQFLLSRQDQIQWQWTFNSLSKNYVVFCPSSGQNSIPIHPWLHLLTT